MTVPCDHAPGFTCDLCIAEVLYRVDPDGRSGAPGATPGRLTLAQP